METQKIYIIPKDLSLDEVELFEGEYVYALKNERTREYIHIHAADRQQAVKRAGWESSEVKWAYPIKFPPKKKMPDYVKEQLKELQKERHELRNSGKTKKSEDVAPTPNSKSIADLVQPVVGGKIRLRDELIALWPTLKGLDPAAKVNAVAQLLKTRNPDIDVAKQSKWYYYKLKRELGD